MAEQFDVHANQITQWKSQLLEGAVGGFGGEAKAETTAAAVDWFSRRVLAWKLSITMETCFCGEALEEALSKNEKPEIE